MKREASHFFCDSHGMLLGTICKEGELEKGKLLMAGLHIPVGAKRQHLNEYPTWDGISSEAKKNEKASRILRFPQSSTFFRLCVFCFFLLQISSLFALLVIFQIRFVSDEPLPLSLFLFCCHAIFRMGGYLCPALEDRKQDDHQDDDSHGYPIHPASSLRMCSVDFVEILL